jgi:hypothetical protein
MILVYSSFIFITNIITTLYFNYYLYASWFTLLTITSVCYHMYRNIYTKIIDKFAILSIILYGGNLLYTKKNNRNIYLVIILFMLSIYIYGYGYITQQYCYHPNVSIGNKYHCLLHIISCIAHHLIIFI